MRNNSPAKRPASSPPVPARISTMTLFSSLGSLGSNNSLRSRSTISLRGELLFLFLRHLLHFGIVGFEKHLVSPGQILFDLLEFAMLRDDFFELGVLLGDLLKLRRVGDKLRSREQLRQFVVTRA